MPGKNPCRGLWEVVRRCAGYDLRSQGDLGLPSRRLLGSKVWRSHALSDSLEHWVLGLVFAELSFRVRGIPWTPNYSECSVTCVMGKRLAIRIVSKEATWYLRASIAKIENIKDVRPKRFELR